MKFLTLTVVSVLTVIALSSCSEWTDPKPIDIKYETIEDAENYQSYLESLRAYKASDHALVYAWVNLSDKAPSTQGERLTSLPDSIDVVVVSPVTDLDKQLRADIRKVREDKAMKTICGVDYDELKATHEAICTKNAELRDNIEAEYSAKDLNDPEVLAEYQSKLAACADPLLKDYLMEHLSAALSFIKVHDLDGALFGFDGKSSLLLDDKALEEYTAHKNLFMDIALDWSERNPDKTIVFMGKPQNIENEQLLNKFDMFLIRETLDASSVNTMGYFYQLAVNTSGIPADKLGVMTSYTEPDGGDPSVGFLANGEYHIDAMTIWLGSNNVAAVGVRNVQNDYFTSPTYSYPHVRALIQAANPKY